MAKEHWADLSKETARQAILNLNERDFGEGPGQVSVEEIQGKAAMHGLSDDPEVRAKLSRALSSRRSRRPRLPLKR